MKTDEFGIEQPENDKSLFRYMDKWKYDSIKNCRFIFTNAKNQDDPYDCYNPYKESGYTRRANYMRSATLLSCWTLDSTYNKDKIIQYCNFRDKADKNDCELAYVIKSTYSKLIEFLKMKCILNRLVTSNNLSWQIRYGIVKYKDIEKIKGAVCQGLDNSCFYKDVDKYKNENEFRIITQLGNTINKYDDKCKTHIPTIVDFPYIIKLQGNPKDFLTNVYEYNKISGEFRQVGIPHVTCKTIKPISFTPHKI